MIKIKFKYRRNTLWLESDDNQWIVHEGFTKSELKSKKIIYTKKNPSYLTTLESAISYLTRLHIRKSDAKTLFKLNKNINEIQLMVEKELNIHGTNKTKTNKRRIPVNT